MDNKTSNNFKRYIIFWASQALSQLGSSMTSFALILFAYSLNNSAMTVSLLSVFNYVPYIIVTLFVGAFIDSHSKKKIMLASDTICALCSVAVVILNETIGLQIWHIYLINCVIGIMSAFQVPASEVAIKKVVPNEKLTQVSGMNSFSSNLVGVLSPVIAASLFAMGGLRVILFVDLLSFMAAALVLIFVLRIPENLQKTQQKQSAVAGCREGIKYIRGNKGILSLIVSSAVINLFSKLTYENILSPMVLSRSGNDSVALGIVNAVMSIGGIVGSAIVYSGKVKCKSAGMIYISTMFSFLLGDLIMGLGKNTVAWSIAGVAASLPFAFFAAGRSTIMYECVPEEIQGRVFAVKEAIGRCTAPVAFLFGGFLADYVFEPFMMSENALAKFLQMLVGAGAGSGMAVMFLCTGIMGSVYCFALYKKNPIKELLKSESVKA